MVPKVSCEPRSAKRVPRGPPVDPRCYRVGAVETGRDGKPYTNVKTKSGGRRWQKVAGTRAAPRAKAVPKAAPKPRAARSPTAARAQVDRGPIVDKHFMFAVNDAAVNATVRAGMDGEDAKEIVDDVYNAAADGRPLPYIPVPAHRGGTPSMRASELYVGTRAYGKDRTIYTVRARGARRVWSKN